MKYIIVQDGYNENIVLFSSMLKHRDIAKQLTDNDLSRVVSAGQILVDDDNSLVCTGESLTLNLKSRGKQDNIILRASLNT